MPKHRLHYEKYVDMSSCIYAMARYILQKEIHVHSDPCMVSTLAKFAIYFKQYRNWTSLGFSVADTQLTFMHLKDKTTKHHRMRPCHSVK